MVRRMVAVDIPGKRSRGLPNLMWKRACKRCMTGSAERGQHNKRGIMEEENKQSYRQLQMMGQAREKDERVDVKGIAKNVTVIGIGGLQEHTHTLVLFI